MRFQVLSIAFLGFFLATGAAQDDGGLFIDVIGAVRGIVTGIVNVISTIFFLGVQDPRDPDFDPSLEDCELTCASSRVVFAAGARCSPR